MQKQEAELLPLPRKKLWEIDYTFQCALIGTCLSHSEMHKLRGQKVFALAPGNDDYQLHTQFITISRTPDLQGKSLHKYMEKKYRTATRKYFMVATDAEVEALWREDFREGRIASAWWAIMTHPQISTDLVNRLYGQLHMLGHDLTGNFYKKKSEVRRLQMRVAALEEALGAERQRSLEKRNQCKERLSSMAKEIEQMATLVLENQFFREQIAFLKRGIAGQPHASATGLNQESPADKRRREPLLGDATGKYSYEINLLREKQAVNSKRITEMEKQLSLLEQQKEEQFQEITSLENMLLQGVNPDGACRNCADQDTAQCPGRNLCGRTVLYVGGLNRMVPYYRQMVENLGGCFAHHDGGKEASRNILPRMLITADAVLCPIDCVSHDACKCVKKICKRNQKPFVLMRSASLSALAKGLDYIVQQ